MNFFYPDAAIANPTETAIGCETLQESFGFNIENYVTNHHQKTMIDIILKYRLKTEKIIKESNYPDYIPIKNTIKSFFENYPNQTDFWEIMNRQLAQELLDHYPQMTVVDITLNLPPTNAFPHHHFSQVKMLRSGNCPLID